MRSGRQLLEHYSCFGLWESIALFDSVEKMGWRLLFEFGWWIESTRK